MITYLLHGGYTSRNNPNNDAFFAQITNAVPKKNVKVLLCYWAKDKHKWEKKSKSDMDFITKNTDKTVDFHILDKPTELEEMISDYDAIYVAGGEAENIEPYYKYFDQVKDQLDGKVYAGSSMGAFLVSENYLLSFTYQDELNVHQGIGLLPIQTLCHWDIEERKEEKLDLLRSVSDQPIIALDECQFVTIYK